MGQHEDTVRDDMVRDDTVPAPGLTILGGAACGLSYEGAVHDALARYEAAWKREVAQQRRVPPPQAQRPVRPRAKAEAAG